MDIFERDAAFVAGTYGRFPVHLVRGQGEYAWDEKGKKYIDLGSGIAVNTFGYSDPVWAEAVTSQLNSLQHASNLFYTDPCSALAEMICQKTGMKRVFFGNSGAEANECAIKVARKYASDKYGHQRHNIITLKNSFHGRTIATLAATGQDVFHKNFGPFPEGFLYAEANDLESVRALMDENTAAVMVECVQGEGGVVALDKDFLTGVQALCQENDSLFMVDEVQTGNGRTGHLYSYMAYGLAPDVFTTAKGLGGGLPIGACVIGEKAQNTLGKGDHGSTFGGNPTVCAGAISIFQRLNQELLDEVKKKSQYIFDSLTGQKGIKGVTGMGLMIGIETEKPAPEVLSSLRDMGVIALSAKTKVRLLPPLSISWDALKEAVNAIREVCAR